MNIIKQSFKHTSEGFVVEVTTCNKRIATCLNTTTNEKVCFNRAKFEWMIQKGIFSLVK